MSDWGAPAPHPKVSPDRHRPWMPTHSRMNPAPSAAQHSGIPPAVQHVEADASVVSPAYLDDFPERFTSISLSKHSERSGLKRWVATTATGWFTRSPRHR